ncbi:acyl carrier protein [Clostridium sp. AF18-27]|uniref:acyl carrier protein n=1 Tax=Enterocloster lavalensis TaxID=460384 RepID=UPI000E4B3085|nr:acyl carrier protein [Enterocloster lavalensis]RHR51857.1 acyl carrier protein [Clostridium sp. AF18-27]
MEQIYEILSNLRPEFDYHTSQDYIADNLLDSFDIVSLVSELEERYGIFIDALDILPENFKNASAIADVVIKNGGEL